MGLEGQLVAWPFQEHLVARPQLKLERTLPKAKKAKCLHEISVVIVFDKRCGLQVCSSTVASFFTAMPCMSSCDPQALRQQLTFCCVYIINVLKPQVLKFLQSCMALCQLKPVQAKLNTTIDGMEIAHTACKDPALKPT